MTDTPKMTIFSCGCDCESSINKHFASLRSQTFQDFRHIIVDDASKSKALSSRIEILRDERTTVHINLEKQFWLKNAVDYLIPEISDMEIVVVVDLDDWLFQPAALQKVIDVYESDPTVMLTFGSYIKSHEVSAMGRRHPKKAEVRNVFYSKDRRKEAWVFSHLKTFRGHLLKSIPLEYFKWPTGAYIMCGYDRAIMYPMCDLAGIENTRFIQDILLVYNTEVPNNVHKLYKQEQQKTKRYLSTMATLPRLR